MVLATTVLSGCSSTEERSNPPPRPSYQISGQHAEQACYGPVEKLDLYAVELYPEHPSAGLTQVCLVSPASELYLATLGDSTELATPGWTVSAYGNGVFPGTLSEQDVARCFDAFALTGGPARDPNGTCPKAS